MAMPPNLEVFNTRRLVEQTTDLICKDDAEAHAIDRKFKDITVGEHGAIQAKVREKLIQIARIKEITENCAHLTKGQIVLLSADLNKVQEKVQRLNDKLSNFFDGSSRSHILIDEHVYISQATQNRLEALIVSNLNCFLILRKYVDDQAKKANELVAKLDSTTHESLGMFKSAVTFQLSVNCKLKQLINLDEILTRIQKTPLLCRISIPIEKLESLCAKLKLTLGEGGLRLDYDPLDKLKERRDIISKIKEDLTEINQGPEKLDISMLMEIIEKEFREVSDEIIKHEREYEETLRLRCEQLTPSAREFLSTPKSNTCTIS